MKRVSAKTIRIHWLANGFAINEPVQLASEFEQEQVDLVKLDSLDKIWFFRLIRLHFLVSSETIGFTARRALMDRINRINSF